MAEQVGQNAQPHGVGNNTSNKSTRRPRHRNRRGQGQQNASRPQGEDASGSSVAALGNAGSIGPDLALRPASVPPTGQAGSDAHAQRKPRNPRNRRRPAVQPQLNGHGEPSNAVPRRNETQSSRGGRSHTSRHQFGGQLTIDPSAEQSSSTLHAGAPEFHPGKPMPPRTGAQKPERAVRPPEERPRKRRASKSVAPDLATRTHEDITNGHYECPICTMEVLPKSKVWSCRTCWTVFHLHCIKKWSKNQGSMDERPQNGDTPEQKPWRCPGCNLPKDILPSSYSCWCEKEVEPRTPAGLPPHSCGQTCGRPRKIPKPCPHPCELMCHAGPCPPCTRQGPTQLCFCGRNSATRRCLETDYEKGWSCGEVCGDVMPCGEHTCQRKCHEGVCGACETTVEARCYCGKASRSISCCDTGVLKTSELKRADQEEVEKWQGRFSCHAICERTFACGKHSCEKYCHSQDTESTVCPKAPELVTHCPCGKTPLKDLSETGRESCTDPVPNCQLECGRKLSCGHSCTQLCHKGECMPCMRTVTIKCRCGRTESTTICHQGTEEPPQCLRVCKANLNCGRHECGERCCTGERRAAERNSGKKKLRALGAPPTVLDDGFEAEHICTRVCGRPLKCGQHRCQELCHRGPCNTCRDAIFEEVSCSCGRTVLQPPLPCGTRPPPCRFPCERGKSCGHPPVAHNCHGDEEVCPKCPFLMQKACMCGKKRVKNQPCWLSDVRCGEKCGKMLRCGSHYCQKTCHRPGQCEDADGPCTQTCGKAKKSCGHSCEDACHAPAACREEKPCTHKIMITCDCQHVKQEMKCNASKGSEGNTKRGLKCDEECARLERNRKLAVALDIDPETHTDSHVPYSDATLQMYKQTPSWCQAQERVFRTFAADEEERRLRFKPMGAQQRGFIHALAEDFGLDSESMDPDPHRHVAVFKTPRFVAAPMKKISQCIDIRQVQTPTPAAQPPQTGHASRDSSHTAYNGFLLSHARFALTQEELREAVTSTLKPASKLDIHFLPSDEVVLHLPSHTSHDTPLRHLTPAVTSAVTKPPNPMATSVQLCHFDVSTQTVRRETDPASGAGAEGGWNQVAKTARSGGNSVTAASLRAPKVGGGTVFTPLTRRPAAPLAKKPPSEPVVDDWETAMEEEQRTSTSREQGGLPATQTDADGGERAKEPHRTQQGGLPATQTDADGEERAKEPQRTEHGGTPMMQTATDGGMDAMHDGATRATGTATDDQDALN